MKEGSDMVLLLLTVIRAKWNIQNMRVRVLGLGVRG